MRFFYLLLFICCWAANSIGQKVQIHYLLMDTLKSKNEFLEFVKSLEAQKEFGKINMSFYFIGKKEFNDSTWNNKKQVIKLFYSKIPCNGNLNQVLNGEDNIINQLNSSTKNTLISTKSTFNEMDLDIPFDFQSNSMTSQLSLLEKIKELVKLKIVKDHHLLVIEKNFSFQNPEVWLDPKNVIINTSGQTINFKTSTPFRTLNLGKGLSIDGPNRLKISPEINNATTISYIDGLGCVSNTDTLKIEIPKACSCEKLIGNFGLTTDYLKTMNAINRTGTDAGFDWTISPQQDGTTYYIIIINPKTDCFDAIELEFNSSDASTKMQTETKRIYKSEMKKHLEPEGWEFDLDLSKDKKFIKNSNVFSVVSITPLIKDLPCENATKLENIKFSSCSTKGVEEK
jgi:hypothetical protein